MSLVTAHLTLIPLPLGHYVSDGLDRDVGQTDPNDCWLTNNDAQVTDTTGASACEQRNKSSCILFYKRHVSGKHQAHVHWHETHPGNVAERDTHSTNTDVLSFPQVALKREIQKENKNNELSVPAGLNKWCGKLHNTEELKGPSQRTEKVSVFLSLLQARDEHGVLR